MSIQDEDFQGTEPSAEASEFEQFLDMMKTGGEDYTKDDEDESQEEDLSSAPVEPEEDIEDNKGESEEAEGSEDPEQKEDEEDSESEDEEDTEQVEEVSEDIDPVEVDFDTVITLPNGTEVSIEELSGGYKAAQDLKDAREAFEEERRAFEDNSKDVSEKLDLAKLEAQRVLDDFKDFDWQKLAQEDPQEFANTKLFVEKYATRKHEIEKAQADIQQRQEAEKANELNAKARACVKRLEQDLPEWNQALYEKVIRHAVELGMDQDAALNLTDAGVIKALVNSLNMDKSTKVVKAKITKKVKAPAKVVKPGATKAKPGKGSSNFKNEAEEFAFFSKFI